MFLGKTILSSEGILHHFNKAQHSFSNYGSLVLQLSSEFPLMTGNFLMPEKFI